MNWSVKSPISIGYPLVNINKKLWNITMFNAFCSVYYFNGHVQVRKLFVYQTVTHRNSPFLPVKSLLLMTGDVLRGDGPANARRLAFNVPSASVQNKSLEEARMLLGDVEVIFCLIPISQYISHSYGSDVHQLSIWGLHVGYPPQLWPFTTYNFWTYPIYRM